MPSRRWLGGTAGASQACRRRDLAASLIAKGFVREIRAKAGVPVWREDESGRYALKILKAGREVIGVEDEGQDAGDDTSAPEQQTGKQARQPGACSEAKGRGSKARAVVSPATETSASAPSASKGCQSKVVATQAITAAATPPTKSKRVLVTSLLERPQGAAIADLTTATGWLPHTTRAFLSGLRKGGLNISRSKGDGDSTSVYRIVAAKPSTAAA